MVITRQFVLKYSVMIIMNTPFRGQFLEITLRNNSYNNN